MQVNLSPFLCLPLYVTDWLQSPNILGPSHSCIYIYSVFFCLFLSLHYLASWDRNECFTSPIKSDLMTFIGYRVPVPALSNSHTVADSTYLSLSTRGPVTNVSSTDSFSLNHILFLGACITSLVVLSDEAPGLSSDTVTAEESS